MGELAFSILSAYVSVVRGHVTVLEIVFVGQCEVFVCLDLVLFFFLGCEAHRSIL